MASLRQNSTAHEVPQAKDWNPERILVQQILSSQCFEKSARMRDFLAYVCDRALNEPQAEVHEQEIGCAVFGRAPDYDTNQDNIVRVNASQLRKRLKTYFASEGQSEQLVLELPKGHYTPVFRVRSGHPSTLDPRRRLIWSLAILSSVLAVLCIALAATLLWGRIRPAGESADRLPMKALWSRLIKNGQATEVVLADSSLGLTQDLIGKPVPLSEYIHPNIWLQAPSLDSRPDAQLAARYAARRHYTDMASVNAARRILTLAGTSSGSGYSRVVLRFARDFNLQQLKSDNVILLGSRRTNPWVEIVENRLSFHFGFDMSTRQAYFENKHPLAGELASYANDPATSYCQIAFVPNLSGTGNTLVISGTDPEGTETGAEFLTTETGIASLRGRLGLDHAGQLPYFEVLLKSARVGGAIPSCEIVAARRN